jgi:uncharacterized protein YjbI with pentapeptide repeats
MIINGYTIEPNANLASADLENADLSYEQLTGATMPDGTIHE